MQGIEFQIVEDSTKAVQSVNNLSTALKSLRTATSGGISGLSKAATQINALKNALKTLNTGDAASKLAKLSSALSALGSSSANIRVGTVAKNLSSLNSAIANIKWTDGDKLTNIANGLKPLSQLGRSNMTSFINQLKKLPEVIDQLEKTDLDKFTRQLQSLASAMKPFADEMQKVSAGFSAFPSRIQKVIASTEQYNSTMRKTNATGGLGLLGTGLQLTGAYFAIRQVSDWISTAITKSNEYQENLNLFTVAMGEYADQAYEYGKTVSEVLGIDFSQWVRNQGVFNTLLTGFGNTADRAAIMSKNLTQLGYDLSSFFNISVDDAMQKLQSGISGELEPLRRLGFDLSQARLEQEALNLGIDKSVMSMTQAEKAELRYYAIMTQVTTAQGDLARTLEAPANQLRILQAQFTMAAQAIGNIFIPALNAILPYAIAVVQVIREIADAIATFFGFELAEVDYSGISTGLAGVEDQADGVADSFGDAASSAAELKKYLAGFDELNVLPDQSTGTGGGAGSCVGSGASGGGLGFELPEYDFLGDAVKQQVDKVKESVKDLLDVVAIVGLTFLAWKIPSTLVPAISGIISSLKAAPILYGLTFTLSGVTLLIKGISSIILEGIDSTNFASSIIGSLLTTGGAALLGGGIAKWITTAFSGSAVASAITSAGGASAIAFISGAVAGLASGAAMFVAGIYSAVTEGINVLSASLVAIGATASGAAIGAMIGSVGGPLGALIGLAVGAVTDLTIFIVQNWDTVSQFFVNLWAGIVDTVNGAWVSVQEWWGNTAEWWKTTIIDPVEEFFVNLWDGIGNAASVCVDAVIGFFTPVKDWFGDLFSSIGQTVSDVFYNIGVIAGGCWEIIQTAWSIAANWFNTNVITPVSTFFSNAWNGISTAAGTAWSNIKSAFGEFSSWFNSKVITPVSGFFSNLWSGVKSKASDAWNGIKSVFSQAGNFFRDTFKAAWQKVVGVFSTAGEIFVDIKDGILAGFKSIVNKIISGINKVVSVPFNGINSALTKIKNISILGITPFSGIRNISIPQIPMLASGGFVDQGQMFIARESGAEMVGSIGRRTAVANNDQIVEGISDGVSMANMGIIRVLNKLIQVVEDKDMSVNLDSRQVTKAQNNRNRMYGKTLQNV